MGGRYLHSSQISGFATGKLREPSPKVFVVIGRLNQALASGQLPSELQELWANKTVLADTAGNSLDAVGCFRAFTGELDLGLGNIRSIPEDQVGEANKRLGRFVRSALVNAGVDFIEELPEFVADGGPLVKSLILGQQLSAQDLVESLSGVQSILTQRGIEVTVEYLWDKAIKPTN